MGAENSAIPKYEPEDPYLSDSDDIFDFSNMEKALIKIKLQLSNENIARKFNSDKVYQVSHGRRGRCLIINNYEFKELWTRHGSEIDVRNLAAVFSELGFQVIIKQNIKTHEFTSVLQEELNNPDHGVLGMFVLIVMSHGGPGNKIYGIDDSGVDQHTLFKMIYNCEPLRNKPKFIVVQACAGEDLPKGSHGSPAAYENASCSTDPRVPASCYKESSQPNDVLIFKSAFDGFVSLRFEHFGSPFIRALVEALYKHSHHCDLVAICKQVMKKIEIFNKRGTDQAPLPCYISFLKKELYLFPNGTTTPSGERPGTSHAYPDPAAGATTLEALPDRLADSHQKIQYKCCARTGYDKYWSVHWISGDLMVTGSSQGIKLWDRQLNLIKSLSLYNCFDVVPYKDQLIVLVESYGTNTISLYTQNLKKVKDLVSFSTTVACCQVTTMKDIVFAADIKKKQVYCWTINGQPMKTIKMEDMTDPTGLCATADGNLIITKCIKRGSVKKYQIGGDYRLLWESVELAFPYGISEDSRGFVYISGGEKYNCIIHVLSSNGLLLKGLICNELQIIDELEDYKSALAAACLRSNMGIASPVGYGLDPRYSLAIQDSMVRPSDRGGFISVFNDTLAAACGGLGLKLYQLAHAE